MRTDRHLAWEGCWNVRDLGGLPTRTGVGTRWGAVVRSDDPRNLTQAGWAALESHGVRTIVALRTDGAEKDEPDVASRPQALTTVEVSVEDFGDAAFMRNHAESGLWSTPLYYRDALDRWPEKSAAAIAAIANAAPGGVLVHCGVGRDRTGLVVLLLLALAGVPREAIVADYELTYERMRRNGDEAEIRDIQRLLARHDTSPRAQLLDTLASLDAERYLEESGVLPAELGALRSRLLA